MQRLHKSFKVGHLVSPYIEFGVYPMYLYNDNTVMIDNGDQRITGYLEEYDCAIVVSIDGRHTNCVYIVGPHGSGWANVAMLNVISDV